MGKGHDLRALCMAAKYLLHNEKTLKEVRWQMYLVAIDEPYLW